MGADIHDQNDRALRLACEPGLQEITETLVEQGANINVIDEDGYTPISYAEEGGFTNIVAYLQSKIKG